MHLTNGMREWLNSAGIDILTGSDARRVSENHLFGRTRWASGSVDFSVQECNFLETSEQELLVMMDIVAAEAVENPLSFTGIVMTAALLLVAISSLTLTWCLWRKTNRPILTARTAMVSATVHERLYVINTQFKLDQHVHSLMQ
jgi:hypothetical protein